MPTTRPILSVMVVLALWPAPAFAESGSWETYNDAGIEAFLVGDAAEAERQFKAAIKLAEEAGPDDPRLALSLYSLGRLLISPLKKAPLTGFHSTAKHNAAQAVSPSSETMRTM